MCQEAAARGEPLRSPLLVLGVIERVGSNWLSDTLRVVADQHNEPFRQQIAAEHPLSALNPCRLDPGSVSADALGPLGVHWLTTFMTSKYAVRRQVVKETNLFFATQTVVDLFPRSPVVVLSRSPVGIVSSFQRSGLFHRWAYPDRYAQLVAASRQKRWRQWQPLVPDDAPAETIALARLIVLNAVLLSEALVDRTVAHIAYETAVNDQAVALRIVQGIAPDLGPVDIAKTAAPGTPTVDDVFATTGQVRPLIAHLSLVDAEAVRGDVRRCLATAWDLAPAEVSDAARQWLAGDDHYTIVGQFRPSSRHAVAGVVRLIRPSWVPLGPWWCRSLLVSNKEFCGFLNALHDHGATNTVHGTHLLFTEMPHARGGRIHFDPAAGRYRVSDGYADHPVYWVTWIGAAAFALHAGACLPTLAQARTLAAGVIPASGNTDYRVGDVTNVAEPDRGGGQVHHPVGNVQIWCQDGPTHPLAEAGHSRYLHGAAWNTPDAATEVDRVRTRHLLGSSRGVGIRLARDTPDGTPPVPVPVVAARLAAWLVSLDNRSRSVTELDQIIVDALTGRSSQADVGLGAHVRPGIGEAAGSQLDEAVTEPVLGKLGELHERHATDGSDVEADRHVTDDASDSPGLEREMGYVNLVGDVITDVQQPTHGHVKPGLLAHFPDQRVADRLTGLDLPARQAPRPAGVRVLVQQQDLTVLDQDSGDPHKHPPTLTTRSCLAAVDADVVIAAGGLGTRVRRWSRMIPKEFYPVEGQPGIIHLLHEIAALGRARVVIVYHPYYGPFVNWARHALDSGTYQSPAGLIDAEPIIPTTLDLIWQPQHGRYADVTSLLNAVDYLDRDTVYLAFADNLYPGTNPLTALAAGPERGVAVLARPYTRTQAHRRGVIVTASTNGCRYLTDVVEKPDPRRAAQLEDQYGIDNLLLLEGRCRLTDDFIGYVQRWKATDPGEPKLAHAIRDYGRRYLVRIVTVDSAVIDLGDPT
jgi:UTP-glucose-1-phosphate uridylyltransferase